MAKTNGGHIMAIARFNDTGHKYETIGEFDTLASAKQACIEHAKSHVAFIGIMLMEDDGDQGFDMAVHLGAFHIRLYCADA